MAKKTPGKTLIPLDPKAQAAVKNAETVLARIAALKITSQSELEIVSSTLIDVKGSISEIEAAFKPLEEPLKRDLAKLSAPRLKAVKLLKAGETRMKELISTWIRTEQERIDRENATLLLQSQKKEAAKIKRKTGEVVDPASLDVPAPYVEPMALPDGITPVKHWTWEAEEGGLAKLVKAAAREPQLLRYLDFNETTIQSMAEELEEIATLEGVRFLNEGFIRAAKKGD